MNELQKRELYIFDRCIEAIRALGLRYYMVCGSALGAVKYRGFIPWDDDIDIALPREDYEVFIRRAKDYLPKELFVQCYKTEERFPQLFAKVRDSSTTYIEKSVAKIDMNHGVFIDVFPLDGYPTAEEEIEKLERVKASCLRKLSCCYDLPRSFKAKLGYRWRRIKGYHKYTRLILEKYTRAISKYSPSTSSIWCNHGNWQGKLEYAPREQYGEGAWMSFEGRRVRVPERYDEYLTQKYGDWRADPPKEEQKGHHTCINMRLDMPYYRFMDIR